MDNSQSTNAENMKQYSDPATKTTAGAGPEFNGQLNAAVADFNSKAADYSQLNNQASNNVTFNQMIGVT